MKGQVDQEMFLQKVVETVPVKQLALSLMLVSIGNYRKPCARLQQDRV